MRLSISRVVLVLVVALALGAVAAMACSVLDRRPASVVTGDWYEIFFTTPQYPDRPANHRGGIDERLVQFIDGSRRTLDMAIYDFDLQNVAAAMARARTRGVAVRMVTDTDTIENKDEAIQRALQIVRDAGIPIVDDKRGPIMHHKFAVADNAVVLTGSWNFTTGDTYRLNNNAVILKAPQLAENFTAEFEKMFEQRKFGPTKPKEVPNPQVTIGGVRVETHFSSEVDPTPRLVELIRGARRRIDFLAFSFTHDAMGEAVVEKGRAGVAVRGVFERTGSETRFSEYGRMRDSRLDVYQDGNPYVMHHKVFVIDDRYTVFGSFNFSDNAADDNDENLLVIDDPAFARVYLQEIDRVVAQAKNPPARR
jgi:phosphatidylserine/phosphatidylglycerophosphate/cardiolipin synthase-like enzyme